MTRVLMVGFYADLVDDLLRSGRVELIHVIEERDLLPDVPARYRTDPRVELLAGGYQQSDEAFAVALDVHSRQPFEVVVGGREYGVRLAQRLADRLGLRGPGRRAAEASTDKLVLRRLGEQAGLCAGRSATVTGPQDIVPLLATGPLVVKPRSRHASLGVVKVSAASEVPAAWEAVLASEVEGSVTSDRSLRWEYLAEDFVAGHAEVSLESIVAGGAVIFTNSTWKSMGAEDFSPTGHLVPAPLPEPERAALHAAQARLVDVLAISDGILHAEWICTETGPHLIECAVRYPGGKLALVIEAVYGLNLAALWLDALLGTAAPPEGGPAGFAAIGYLRPEPGTAVGVRGADFLADTPWVVDHQVAVTTGDALTGLRSSMDRLGYYICTAPTAELARLRVAEAARAAQVLTETAGVR